MTNKVLAIMAALLVIAIIVGAVMAVNSNNATYDEASSTASPTPIAVDKNLKIVDEVVGTGAVAKVGSAARVNYVGTLVDGTKFDSSYDRNQPFSFTIGAHQVIAGWEQGVQGMKVGGKRKLTIPPDLAYGDRATGSIPANSTLIFEIELLSIN